MQIRNPNIRFAEYADAEIIRHMMEVAVSRLPSRDCHHGKEALILSLLICLRSAQPVRAII